jgi:hypothetical protein
MKWYQRAKVKELLKGDSNTKYFQLIANGKYRKSRIFQLQHEGEIIEGEETLKSISPDIIRICLDLQRRVPFP